MDHLFRFIEARNMQRFMYRPEFIIEEDSVHQVGFFTYIM